ncbi:MAG: phosphoserine phosphatase SerB [Methylovirgula sp.]
MSSLAHVATFIADARHGMLGNDVLRRLSRHLPNAGAPTWLNPGIAADIVFGPLPADAIRPIDKALRQDIADQPIDVILQPATQRRKKLFVADMDLTMIGQECIDELADLVGLRAEIAAITERAMRGEIAFEPALRERITLLRGLPAESIATVLAERVTLMPGATTLVRTMRAHGAYTALISGGFTLFTSEIAATIGFDTHVANVLIVEDGKLTGFIEEPVLGTSAKLEALEALASRHGVALAETLAVGDGANDLAMLARAGLGVAFHAKPAVAAAAHARIDQCDLTALLYAQGYKSSEFRD